MDAIDIDNADDAWRVGAAFFYGVIGAQSPERILSLVTPESAPSWGDFSEARELFEEATLTSLPEYPSPDIAYVKVVSMEHEGYQAAGPELIMARAIITVVRHPTNGWLVHQIGEYGLPEDMPRYA